jgi:hypothetical protein
MTPAFSAQTINGVVVGRIGFLSRKISISKVPAARAGQTCADPVRRATPRPCSWNAFRLAFVLSLTSMCSAPLGAQRDRPANAQLIVGCWNLEPGQFAIIGKTGVDRGQTVLPSLVQFDTVPGKSKSGEPLGRLVRTSASDSG